MTSTISYISWDYYEINSESKTLVAKKNSFCKNTLYLGNDLSLKDCASAVQAENGCKGGLPYFSYMDDVKQCYCCLYTADALTQTSRYYYYDYIGKCTPTTRERTSDDFTVLEESERIETEVACKEACEKIPVTKIHTG